MWATPEEEGQPSLRVLDSRFSLESLQSPRPSLSSDNSSSCFNADVDDANVADAALFTELLAGTL